MYYSRDTSEAFHRILNEQLPEGTSVASDSRTPQLNVFSNTSSLYLIHLCDWISVEIAELNHTDSVEIEVINYFKSELAKNK